jgi:YHS domain-containing protein
MVKDPVCGMQVEKSKASAQVEYKGKTYYLCSLSCKDKFVNEPKKYADLSTKESK